MAEPTPELLESIRRDKHERARAMSPLQRLLTGPELFDAFLARHRAGLRHQHPGETDEQIHERLMHRVAQIQAKDRTDEHP